jgi:hypothetical protein
MQITVQVLPEVADALQSGDAPAAAHHDLIRLSRELGITLEALHPGSTDRDLKTFFAAEVANPQVADGVLAQLRQSPAVLAAYIKPTDALP